VYGPSQLYKDRKKSVIHKDIQQIFIKGKISQRSPRDVADKIGREEQYSLFMISQETEWGFRASFPPQSASNKKKGKNSRKCNRISSKTQKKNSKKKKRKEKKKEKNTHKSPPIAK
jgi:hypothetical protein